LLDQGKGRSYLIGVKSNLWNEIKRDRCFCEDGRVDIVNVSSGSQPESLGRVPSKFQDYRLDVPTFIRLEAARGPRLWHRYVEAYLR